MSKAKANQQITIVFVFEKPAVDKTEQISWEDVERFEQSIEAPLSVLWPHRRVRKTTRAYKQWQRYAATLRRFVLHLKSGLPIEPGLTKTFYETKAQEERLRAELLEKTPPRKRAC